MKPNLFDTARSAGAVIPFKRGDSCPKCGKSEGFRVWQAGDGSWRFTCHRGKCGASGDAVAFFAIKHGIGQAESARRLIAEFATGAAVQTAPPVKVAPVPVPAAFVEKSLRKDFYEQNNFAQWLIRSLGKDAALRFLRLYNIGTWLNPRSPLQGAAIFWLFDGENFWDSRIIPYGLDGHRVKDQTGAAMSWTHCYDRNSGKWLADSARVSAAGRCFFGQHLLSGNDKIVAIVESPKTAVVCGAAWQEMIVLAAGDSGALANPARWACLNGRRVILYPDADAVEKWRDIAGRMIAAGLFVKVDSSYLKFVGESGDPADLIDTAEDEAAIAARDFSESPVAAPKFSEFGDMQGFPNLYDYPTGELRYFYAALRASLLDESNCAGEASAWFKKLLPEIDAEIERRANRPLREVVGNPCGFPQSDIRHLIKGYWLNFIAGKKETRNARIELPVLLEPVLSKIECNKTAKEGDNDQ
jgi:hypothetical protein